MTGIRNATPALILLLAACTPPPETAVKPSVVVQRQDVKDANTQETTGSYAVRSETFVSSSTLDAKLEQVWGLMPEVYKKFSLPVDGINATTHTVTTGQVHIRRSLSNVPLSRYLECGRATLGPNADVYDINLRVETSIRGTDGEVNIQSSLAATGAGVGNGGAITHCSSTGELERRIAAKVAELIPKK